jgi:hypothetical protein
MSSFERRNIRGLPAVSLQSLKVRAHPVTSVRNVFVHSACGERSAIHPELHV